MTTSNKQNKVNIRQPQQKPSIVQRFKKWLNGDNYKPTTQKEQEELREMERESRESAQEDSEGDSLFIDKEVDSDTVLYPEEIED